MPRTNAESLKQIASKIGNGLFASRPTPEEGIKYAEELIEALPNTHKIYMYTALYVALNSIADAIIDSPDIIEES